MGKCWQTNPEIIEGDDNDESEDETAWEKSPSRYSTTGFGAHSLRRIAAVLSDVMQASFCTYATKRLEPSGYKGRGLQKLSVAWAGSLTVSEWDTGLNSKTYGQPKMWQYAERLPNGSSRRVNIHPDRVFILGDYSDDAIGFLEPAYNAFVSLEKVEGGSGESFLKNAARQLNVNFEKEIDFNNLASLYGVSIDELQDKFNEVAGEMNRGNDVLMTTQGHSHATGHCCSGSVSDL